MKNIFQFIEGGGNPVGTPIADEVLNIYPIVGGSRSAYKSMPPGSIIIGCEVLLKNDDRVRDGLGTPQVLLRFMTDELNEIVLNVDATFKIFE